MKRIFLFIAVNLLVVTTISAVINLLGIRPYLTANGIDYHSLLVFCALYGFAGAFISLQLSRWTAKRAYGIQLIDPERPAGQAEAFIVEKVRALCQRNGLGTLPEIGIYESPEVNAFATGPSKDRAILAISTALLNRMDDDAVEGVIGHELSHIANGDMVTMTLLQGVVNTFVMFLARVIAYLIDNALRSRDDDGRGRGGLGYFSYMMVTMALESALMFLAAPVIYWYSRRREYKADSGAARIAGREPMIHALESLKTVTGIVDKRQTAFSTFKINGQGRGLMARLFASHPSLDARIAALREERY